MTRGILVVETELAAGASAAEFHRQYDHVHLPEMLAIEGFVAARRFEPVDGSPAFLAIYEIDAEDIDAVRRRLAEAIRAGSLTTPAGVSDDPPPRVRFFRQLGEGTGC